MVTAVGEELFEHEPRMHLDRCFQGERSPECDSEVLDKRVRKRLGTRSNLDCLGTRYRVPACMRTRRTKRWNAKPNLAVVDVMQSTKCKCRWVWGQFDIASKRRSLSREIGQRDTVVRRKRRKCLHNRCQRII
ncbi:hypothetical protein K503DRAFT_225959 [Rhizopogon vinicolor AM-OR11-026]|uniref:Uncharacterized protein n=1 Tax=Rhizopogon vinicolor AM-OR11-026 TaxID=1314800 RepID=A0A1B7MY85_9AGAM|nr:hypothetical protein K503DRAFT_225959 [Rhizopogon vinicolor AM-OR11-026]